jgi:DNA modification methylase
MLDLDKIHLGDCLELMPSIPSKSIDMILCDLPYGTTACEWDSVLDMGKLWAEYERVIKDNGAIVLTACNIFTFQLWASNPKIFRYRWIWQKNQATNFLHAKHMPLKNFEDVLVFYKRLPTYTPISFRFGKDEKRKGQEKDYAQWNQKRTDHIVNANRLPTSILSFDCELRTDSIHPTQKPVALFEYLIKTYTNEGELVLDNCSGSGTTAIACLNSNRHFICIEKDEGYYKKSLDRIADHEPLLHLGDKC